MIRHKNAYLAWEDRQPVSGVMPGPKLVDVELTCCVCGAPRTITVPADKDLSDRRVWCGDCAVNGRWPIDQTLADETGLTIDQAVAVRRLVTGDYGDERQHHDGALEAARMYVRLRQTYDSIDGRETSHDNALAASQRCYETYSGRRELSYEEAL